MKKNLFIPGLTVAAGVVGFFLRKWELSTAFELDTGLPIASMPATRTLILWSVAVTLVLIGLCAQEKKTFPYDVAFRAESNLFYAVAAVLSAFLLLTSAGSEIITYPITYQTYQNSLSIASLSGEEPPSMLPVVLPVLRIGLCILGFLCVLLIARNLYGARENGKEHLPLLGPCILFCVWLISDYQHRATDPVVQDHIYGTLAICACLLALYEIASYSFQTGRPRRTLVFGLLGVYFSLVTMADHHSLADLFRYGFAVLFLTAHSVLLLGEHSAGEEDSSSMETEVQPHG